MGQKEVHAAFEAGFVPVHLTVMENADKKSLENPGGDKLMAEYGGAKSGLPFYAILNENGKKVGDANRMPGGQNIGYPGAPEEIEAFDKLLKQCAPRLKAADRATIITALRKNAPPGQ